MLNVYLAPRKRSGAAPEEAAVASALAFLEREGLLAARTVDGEHPPGTNVAMWFHHDAHEGLLPAELTFDSLRVDGAPTPRFLPERQKACGFDASCTVCGDTLDEKSLDEALVRLGYFSVDRFNCLCPSCRSELTLRQIDFGQSTAVARWWLYIEGAATSRLNGHLIDQLERLLGLPLVVVPEVPEEQIEDWVPARRVLRRPR